MIVQEAILDRHYECRGCGARWVESSEVGWPWEAYCCGVISVREVPGQLVFSDSGGGWVRRRERS